VVNKDVIKGVRHYLLALKERGITVSFGVIFGSQATGKAHKWSDIDLLVVSPRFDRRRNRRDIDLLWHVAIRTDTRIEPIACGEKQWERDDASAIIEIARREGKRVSLN
jgi:uncharacterized protein